MSATSQQSEMADRVYRRLADSPVSTAGIVQELRTKWGPGHDVREVHRFADEVAACVLHHEDVEIGDIHNARFRSWGLESWDAHSKLEHNLLSIDSFLDDNERFVFRRTRKA
jgi:hypothetical protein